MDTAAQAHTTQAAGNVTTAAERLFAGPGEVRALCRTLDWAATRLGPVDAWPQSLRTAVDVCLGSAFASFLWWGPELVQLYNDAALGIVRAKHPESFAVPARGAWADVWEVVGSLAERVIATGEAARGEDLPLVPDRGGPHDTAWLTFSYSAVRDETGAVAGMFVTAIETTIRVNAERRLSDVAGRAGLSADFRALFEAAPTPFLVLAPPDFAIVAVNDAYLRVTMTERSAILGRALFDVFPDNPDDPAATGVANLRASLERVLATRRPDAMALQRYDIRRPPFAGGGFVERWWSPVNTPVGDAHGEVALIIHRVEDVTEIVRLRSAGEAQDRLARDQQAVVDRLRDSEARYRALATASADVIYRMSPDWGEMRQLDGRGFLSDTRQPSAAWLGRYIHPDDQARVTTAIAEAIRTQSTFALEHRVIRADGSLGWTSSRAVPVLDAAGEVVEWIGAASDVTARKEAELAVRASEARYRALFDSIDEGFCVVEVLFDGERAADYRFLEANPAFIEQTGLTDAVGRTMRELAPAHEAHWFETYGRVALTGEPTRFEAPAAALGRWYDVYAFRVGEPAERRVAILFKDIAPSKRTEAALRENEARYRHIVEGARDYAIVTTDPLGRITSWSPGAEAIFGWTVAEADGQPFAMTFTPEDRAAGEPERELATAAERGVASDVRWHQARDGARVFMDGTTRALHDERGRLSGFLKVGQDVTHRRALDDALRASEARYRTLVENVRDYAIFLLDAAGVVTEWTPGAERVKGYAAAEVVGRHVSLFYTAEDVAAGEPARELTEAAGTGRAEREGWRVRKGGARFWANEIATAVRGRDGRLVGFTTISRDLSERRRAEESAELVRATSERDASRRRLARAEEDERRRLSRELHDEVGQHLAALALGLQGLSDVAPPNSEVDRRAAELRVLASTLGRELHAIAVRLRPRALDDFGLEAALSVYAEDWSRQSGIAVDVHARVAAERLPDFVESALYRIVQEALTNVARHSGATRVSIVVERRDGHVVAVVEDDGQGFDSDDAVGARDGESGLGLLGMRERAALLGGTLDIESTPGGGGTTLFVRIPVAPPDAAARNADDSRRNDG